MTDRDNTPGTGSPPNRTGRDPGFDFVLLFVLMMAIAFVVAFYQYSYRWSIIVGYFGFFVILLLTYCQSNMRYLCRCEIAWIRKTACRIANMGEKLWHFENLWFMVLLIGSYMALASAVEKYYVAQSAKQALDPALLGLEFLKEIMIAAFLAVVTSVLSNSYRSNVEQSSAVTETTKGVRDLYEELQHHSSQTRVLLSEANRSLADMEVLNGALLASGAVATILKKCDNIQGKGAYVEALRHMTAEMTQSMLLSLKPLLPVDSVFNLHDRTKLLEDLKRIVVEDDQPHFALMSAVLSRSFESESFERHLPGVLLNISSFACYVKTVQEIVTALEPWHDRYEFYTLMPETPLDVFLFRNSTEFEDWYGFLKMYNKVAARAPGKWNRYFAVNNAANGEHTEGIPVARDVKDLIRLGRVVVAKDDDEYFWLPKTVGKNDCELGDNDNAWTTFFNGINAHDNRERIRELNAFHGDKGTLVLHDNELFSNGKAPEGGDWRWMSLKDVLLGYHGCSDLTDGTECKKATSNFRFRVVKDEWKQYFGYAMGKTGADGEGIKNIKIASQPPNPQNGRSEVIRSFRYPVDLFAIRDIINNEWVFFMGRLTSQRAEMEGVGRVAVMPIVDLLSLKHSFRDQNCTNALAYRDISDMLDKVFTGGIPDGVFTFDEFMNEEWV